MEVVPLSLILAKFATIFFLTCPYWLIYLLESALPDLKTQYDSLTSMRMLLSINWTAINLSKDPGWNSFVCSWLLIYILRSDYKFVATPWSWKLISSPLGKYSIRDLFSVKSLLNTNNLSFYPTNYRSNIH